MKNQIEKIKITQADFDEMYEIENIDEKITNDLEKIIHTEESKEESVLTEEQQKYDDEYLANYNRNEESAPVKVEQRYKDFEVEK